MAGNSPLQRMQEINPGSGLYTMRMDPDFANLLSADAGCLEGEI